MSYETVLLPVKSNPILFLFLSGLVFIDPIPGCEMKSKHEGLDGIKPNHVLAWGKSFGLDLMTKIDRWLIRNCYHYRIETWGDDQEVASFWPSMHWGHHCSHWDPLRPLPWTRYSTYTPIMVTWAGSFHNWINPGLPSGQIWKCSRYTVDPSWCLTLWNQTIRSGQMMVNLRIYANNTFWQ